MLMRISLIAAILFGIAVVVLNLELIPGASVTEKIKTIQAQREDQRKQKETAQKDAADTHKKLNATTAELKTTTEKLKVTTQERDQAVTEADSQKKRADGLTVDLAKARKERDDAQGELKAFQLTELTPPQIIRMRDDFKTLQDENAKLGQIAERRARRISELTNELARFITKDYHGPLLPPALVGKVLVTDPKWNFGVLNVGQDQGVLEYGELLVNRAGRLVGKVQVRSVQKDRCIANVMPGWQLGEVMEGDQVIPAYPGQAGES